MIGTGSNCWVELNREALASNIQEFKRLIGPERKFMAVVKSNAYGHGMLEVAQMSVEAGADWLGVFSIDEGLELRRSGLLAPILILGPPVMEQVRKAHEANLSLTVSSLEVAAELAKMQSSINLHLKIETGTNRQGISEAKLERVLDTLTRSPATIQGVYTHFADIEDTTEHSFAQSQLERFNNNVQWLHNRGVTPKLAHTACSAAAILFPKTYFDMVRVGISLYGLWPSRETRVSAGSLGREGIDLRPVLSWKTRIAQIKQLKAGEFVGYGRTFKTGRPSKIAVLPVGYADGYDRRLSNHSHVLIGGMRAPLRGRICMNLTMVDVTDLDSAAVGDEVVLIGHQGDELVTADDLANWIGTINYEVITRISGAYPRLIT